MPAPFLVCDHISTTVSLEILYHIIFDSTRGSHCSPLIRCLDEVQDHTVNFVAFFLAKGLTQIISAALGE